MRDRLAGGAERRLARAVERLAIEFGGQSSDTRPSAKAARDYGLALQLALRVDAAQAADLVRCYDVRIPPEYYPLSTADEAWLAELTSHGDGHVLAVVFAVATRLGLRGVQLRARNRLADLLAADADARAIVGRCDEWRTQGVLDGETVARIVGGYVVRSSLDLDEQLWRRFFEGLPRDWVPNLFEVACLLGHGATAVQMAGSPAQVRQALNCCLQGTEIGDAIAGLELARERDADLVDAMVEHLCRCYEQSIQSLMDQQEFIPAARQVQDVISHLAATERTAARQAEFSELRIALLGATRRHFAERAQHDPDSQSVYRLWSRFEEAAGEQAEAARQAENGGEYFRAHQLFRQARQFGESVRVLRHDETPAALAARAEACEAGGDLSGAARLYERIDQLEQAATLFMAAGDFAAASVCLTRWLGGEAPEDARLAECLRRTGDYDELVSLCLAAVAARGSASRAAKSLRQLTADGLVPLHRAAEVGHALGRLDARERHRFEERTQAWVARARGEVDRRYSDIWGFDLGTTTCAAAIYDAETRQPVFCPWKGQVYFASTVSVDREGNELIGLSGEETLMPWLVGHIDAAKRRMGRGTVYKIRDHAYRPEEVAARLVRHGRGLVENFLTAQVRDRVAELAHAELGMVRDEWLTWAEQNHDLRLPRPRVVVTIPAYFTNNQKAATRSACRIADVTLVRLVHEPTVACITAARERRLTDAIAVVDLGAGTLDISLVDVGDNVYEAQEVSGDTQFGSKDLDAAITEALAQRLRLQGIEVPARGTLRRRLEIAAERLKIDLSAQEHASYELRGAGVDDLRLELNRAELASILAEPLTRLHTVCADFRASARTAPKHLVLIGRPMLSPLVRETVESAFGMTRTVASDPRTAVASGAALLGAMRAGALDDVLLIDVTPLSLGIRTRDEHEQEHLSELVPSNTMIPAIRSQIFTTRADQQTVVRVEIFNGALDRESKIGQFELTGIPPVKAGVPQIEVTFEIDADCVLAVTARDQGTGQSSSIRIADTTLLSPAEVADLTRRYDRQREIEQRQQDAAELRDRLREAAEATMDDDSAAAWQEFCHRRDTYRAAPGTQDAETQRMLVEIFNDAGRTELDLARARQAVRESAVAALDQVERPDGDLEAATRLADELEARTTELRELVTKVARWNALLVRQALNEPDPLQRFRNHYAAGDHRQALAAHPEPPVSAVDLRRYAHCLAETGDLDGYRALRRTASGPVGPRPDAMVRIQAPGSPSGAGFLVQQRLVITTWSCLGDADSVVVEHDGGTKQQVQVRRVDSAGIDLAVLQLPEDAAAVPPRLGYAKLVGIGDPVRTPGAVGLVERFESGSGVQTFRTSLRVPLSSVGQPVFNDLDEVVGVIVSTANDGARVLAIDAADPLLRAAGFDRHA